MMFGSSYSVLMYMLGEGLGVRVMSSMRLIRDITKLTRSMKLVRGDMIDTVHMHMLANGFK